MLILRGIRNQLHEEPALQYAKLRGYTGEVLDVSGEVGRYSNQTNAALRRIARGDVRALYGFSGGGYNIEHIYDRLPEADRNRLKEIVIIGANVDPRVIPHATIWNAPGVEHMFQPDAYLEAATRLFLEKIDGIEDDAHDGRPGRGSSGVTGSD